MVDCTLKINKTSMNIFSFSNLNKNFQIIKFYNLKCSNVLEYLKTDQVFKTCKII